MIYLSLFLFGVLFNRVRRVYLRFIVALSSHTMSYCFGWLDKNWLLKLHFMPPSKTNRTPNEDYQKRNFSVATFNALSLGTQQGYIGRNQLESLAFFFANKTFQRLRFKNTQYCSKIKMKLRNFNVTNTAYLQLLRTKYSINTYIHKSKVTRVKYYNNPININSCWYNLSAGKVVNWIWVFN